MLSTGCTCKDSLLDLLAWPLPPGQSHLGMNLLSKTMAEAEIHIPTIRTVAPRALLGEAIVGEAIGSMQGRAQNDSVGFLVASTLLSPKGKRKTLRKEQE